MFFFYINSKLLQRSSFDLPFFFSFEITPVSIYNSCKPQAKKTERTVSWDPLIKGLRCWQICSVLLAKTDLPRISNGEYFSRNVAFVTMNSSLQISSMPISCCLSELLFEPHLLLALAQLKTMANFIQVSLQSSLETVEVAKALLYS